MGISQARHRLGKHKRTKMALAGIAGMASVAAIVAGTAQADTINVRVVDSTAGYPHAVSIWVDNQFRRCATLYPGSDVQFGPRTSGSYVWIREYTGANCYDGSAALKTVKVYGVKPQQTIDLARYPSNGNG